MSDRRPPHVARQAAHHPRACVRTSEIRTPERVKPIRPVTAEASFEGSAQRVPATSARRAAAHRTPARSVTDLIRGAIPRGPRHVSAVADDLPVYHQGNASGRARRMPV